MNGYIRTTRECSVSQLHPGLAQSIREYFQNHQLGDVDAVTRMCCETVAEKRNPGKLASLLDGNPDTTIHLAMLLTQDWLIWARRGDRSETVVSGARLKVIRIKAFVARQTKDMEIELSGFVNDTKEFVRGSLKMGPELAAQKFCEEIMRVVLEANPPEKKKIFGQTRS